jgi:hypothetical protein
LFVGTDRRSNACGPFNFVAFTAYGHAPSAALGKTRITRELKPLVDGQDQGNSQNQRRCDSAGNLCTTPAREFGRKRKSLKSLCMERKTIVESQISAEANMQRLAQKWSNPFSKECLDMCCTRKHWVQTPAAFS